MRLTYDFFWQEYSYFAQARSQKIEQLKESLYSQTSQFEFNDWFRFIDIQYNTTPLSAKGSRISARGGRFNFGVIDEIKFPNFAALYIAENELTARAEKFQRRQSNEKSGFVDSDSALKPITSFTAVRLRGRLDLVLDLTKNESLKGFLKHIKKISISEKVAEHASQLGLSYPQPVNTMSRLKEALFGGNWAAYPMFLGIPSSSQIFGLIAHAAGVQAILFNSRFTSNKCLAVFPENLSETDSYVEVSDPVADGIIKRLDSSTWQNLV